MLSVAYMFDPGSGYAQNRTELAQSRVASPPVCEREMAYAARKHEMPLGVLYAVGLTETGRRGSLQPFTLNIDGRSFFGTNLVETMREFERSRNVGAKFIDIGCMQINHRFHSRNFSSLEAMFDPHQNVEYAARFLKNLRQREGSWTLAVARYNAGPNNNPAQKRYVCAVIHNMVSSGVGGWTPAARGFCGQN